MPPKAILVVDDEKDLVELVGYNLEREGFTVLRTFDGEKALEIVQTNQRTESRSWTDRNEIMTHSWSGKGHAIYQDFIDAVSIHIDNLEAISVPVEMFPRHGNAS